jgi:hypothetical protein
MKLNKSRFSTWEDKDAKDYEKKFDDELIITVYPNESSAEIADYILEIQKKAEMYDNKNRLQ